MIRVRRAGDRGHAQHGWLESFHTFSFAGYHDPEHMGFRDLRVINEDRVQPGRGFETHSHRDMEIVSYVVSGALEHRDSLGNGSVIRPGDLQRMSAGTGVTHSEYNASDSELVHFLQIWVLPERRGLEPGYEQKHFPAEERRGRLRPVVASDGREGSVRIHQDVVLYAGLLEPGQAVAHGLDPARHAWLQVVAGDLEVGGSALGPGDGLALSGEGSLSLRAAAASEILLFDLS